MSKALRAYLVDDEPLAVKRLARLLEEDGRVEIIGSNSDAVTAAEEIRQLRPDVLFLDIEMPGMTGFDLLRILDFQPLIVFTTAYSQYALRAFEVNSIDYLLKPVEAEQLERALSKLHRIAGGTDTRPDVNALLNQLTAALQQGRGPDYPHRLASRTGEKVEFVDLEHVTHIFAKDKLTYAATPQKNYCVDSTIAELESKLDPKQFVRIHRSTIVNTTFVHEMYTWFAGRMLIRLRDEKHTELTVARDRVKALKEQLGL